ncbi:hypothetical protein K0U00_23935, partial [Paenibacillus sepulcri]|nr:hypothetical protein [Paenibacillus sepulcri]
MAWHGKAKDRTDIRQVIDSSWRAFAEHAIAQHNRTNLLAISYVWMRDDLYIWLPLPEAREELLEEQLLELGSRFKREWGRRFMDHSFDGDVQ